MWKVFDIVWVMTGGRDGTQVVAQQMVQEFFTNFEATAWAPPSPWCSSSP